VEVKLMAKANRQDYPETGKPLPHCKAILLCEKPLASQHFVAEVDNGGQ
jgi:hypothetical protein